MTGSASAQTKLKWAHVYEVSEPYHSQALWAAEEIKKRTGGRYEIGVFPAAVVPMILSLPTFEVLVLDHERCVTERSAYGSTLAHIWTAVDDHGHLVFASTAQSVA